MEKNELEMEIKLRELESHYKVLDHVYYFIQTVIVLALGAAIVDIPYVSLIEAIGVSALAIVFLHLVLNGLPTDDSEGLFGETERIKNEIRNLAEE